MHAEHHLNIFINIMPEDTSVKRNELKIKDNKRKKSNKAKKKRHSFYVEITKKLTLLIFL